MWQRRVGRLKRRAWRRRLINGFIVWQIFCVAIWLMPPSWTIVGDILPADGSGPVRAYMTITLFMQSWQMYAPNPDNRDIWIDAKVQYKDGTTRLWALPRVKDMSYARRYPAERLRKWVEVASRNATLWYPLARYAARSCDTNPANPPVTVVLRQHVRLTPPLGRPTAPPTTTALCIAQFKPEDLR